MPGWSTGRAAAGVFPSGGADAEALLRVMAKPGLTTGLSEHRPGVLCASDFLSRHFLVSPGKHPHRSGGVSPLLGLPVSL